MSQSGVSRNAANESKQQQDGTSSSSSSQKRALNHQEQLKEKARSIAHYLRASKHSTLEQRSARLRDDRVSFFRAKDFYRSLREDPDFVEKECTIGGKTMDDKIEYLGNVLLHCGLIQRCERIYKAPRKGRTKRVKYPHYLEKTKNQSFAYPSNDDDSVQEDYFVLVCGDFDVLYGYFGRARGGFRRRVVGLGETLLDFTKHCQRRDSNQRSVFADVDV